MGFIFGAAISYAQKKSFVPIRKKNKLPDQVISEVYNLEYGTDELEIHVDAIDENAMNDFFEREDDDIIDFSESNPFGDIGKK